MRLLRLLPLLLLPLLVGATCVTHVDQKGPAGPWIGEVVNAGTGSIHQVRVDYQILDANWEPLAIESTGVCPYELAAGDKGYFALPALSSTGAVLPLHVSPLRIAATSGSQPAGGVSFRMLHRYPEHNAILVEATNDSPNTYDLMPCAVNFDSFGNARDVSTASAFLGTVFKPGDVITFPVQFDSPVDGTFEFSAMSISTYFDTVLNSVPFDYVTRVVTTETGRGLEVVGEITSTSTTDLGSAWYEAYLDSSPTVRTSNFVGSTSMNHPFSGDGVLPAGQKTLISFTLPLREGDSDEVNITGAIGKTAWFRSGPRYTFFPVRVSNVTRKAAGLDMVRIGATLSNPADDGLNVDSVCFYARDASGKLVGGLCSAVRPPWIEPRGSAVVSQDVPLIGKTQVMSVDVVAYGHAGPQRPAVTPPT